MSVISRSDKPITAIGIDPGTVRGGISAVDQNGLLVAWKDVRIPKELRSEWNWLSLVTEIWIEAVIELIKDRNVDGFDTSEGEAFNTSKQQISLCPIIGVEGFAYMGAKSMNKHILQAMHFAYHLTGALSQITTTIAVSPSDWRIAKLGRNNANDATALQIARYKHSLSELPLPTKKNGEIEKGAVSHMVDSYHVADFVNDVERSRHGLAQCPIMSQ